MSKLILQSQEKVPETLLIALYARAIECEQRSPLLNDETAVRMVEQIDYDFSRYKLDRHDQVTTIMRVCEFDRLTQDFLARRPNSVIVNIGCGLDTRFERVDNGLVEWYDMDLAEVIEFRSQLVPPAERCHSLGYSVFENTWWELVKEHPGRSTLFLAEGVLPYFAETQIKALFLQLRDNFPSCELVCDAMTPAMIQMHNFRLKASKVKARLQWGLKRGDEPESWGAGIRLLSEWFYFDRPEPRLGASQLMRYIPLFAKGVGIFHYQLG
jgi:O-methyltransferase involved in polyketide biosynthesis